MRKHQLLTAVIFLLFCSTGFVTAQQSFPRGDYFLYGGRIPKVQNPNQTYSALKAAIPATPISIRQDSLRAYFSQPVEFIEDIEEISGSGSRNAYITHTGPVMLQLEGVYDPDLGIVSGTVVYDVNLKALWHDEYWFQEQWKITDVEGDGWQAKGSGKFRGQVVEDNVMMKFSLNDESGNKMTFPAVYRLGKFAEKQEVEEPRAEMTDISSDVSFAAMSGQVEWRAPDDPDGWKLCKLGTKLPDGAHVRTLEDSSAVLGFSDMSTFILKPETEIVITAPPDAPGKIRLMTGRIWSNVQKILRDGTVEVDMNQAVCGIKGTTFYASELDGVSEVRVEEGVVAFRSKITGETMDIRAAESGSVAADGQIQKNNFDPDNEAQLWEKEMNQPVDFSLADALPDPDAPVAAQSAPVSGAAVAPALSGEMRIVDSNLPSLYILAGVAVLLVVIVVVFVLKKRKR